MVLHLCWRIFGDSWYRAQFAFDALAGRIPDLDPFNDRYTAHPYQTLVHMISGIVFSILGPMQFASPIRNQFPRIHRISGRIFLPFGIIAGVAALIMGLSFPVWGFTYNQAIIAGWSLFMIYAFVHAFSLIRKRKFLLHREWMMRGFAAGLAVSVFRLISDVILQPMGYDFNDRWTIVILITLPITLAATEFWIRVTRPKKTN